MSAINNLQPINKPVNKIRSTTNKLAFTANILLALLLPFSLTGKNWSKYVWLYNGMVVSNSLHCKPRKLQYQECTAQCTANTKKYFRSKTTYSKKSLLYWSIHCKIFTASCNVFHTAIPFNYWAHTFFWNIYS